MNIFVRREVFDIMKTRLFIKRPERNKRRWGILIVAVITFCTLSEIAWSIENRSVGIPIGPSTLPPSSVRSGLIRSPNPIDSSGNLIITGNVSGGSYFHGPVPYRSTTSFGAPLGSSSLDSFLRDSTRSDDFDRYFERYRVQPYYSPTETVTTMTPGRSGVFVPSTTRIAERAPDAFGLEDVPKKEVPAGQSTSISDLRLLPTPLNPPQIEKVGSEELAGYPRGGLTSERYQGQMEQLRRDLQRIKDKTSELKQRLGEKDDSLQIPIEGIRTNVEPSERVLQQLEKPGIVEPQTPSPQKQPEEVPAFEPTAPVQKQEQEGSVPSTEKELVWSPDIYERIKQQINNSRTSQAKKKASGVTAEKDSKSATGGPTATSATGGPAATGRYQKATAGEEQLNKVKPYFEIPSKSRSRAEDTYSKTLSNMEVAESSGKRNSALDEVAKLSPNQLSAEAKRIMGPYKDIESFSEARFNQYFLAAETYLKQGKYYRAADSYALASIYKNDDPAAYAGRGHALFAAGEYISSALFISRAVEISAAYAQAKVDLAALLGDRDKLESRIADVEEWVKRSDAAELQFLLGYVYYRIGRLDRAKQAIDTAYEKMPQWPAVRIVKKAIDDAIGSVKTK
jgi:Flp pilus assembly protein TadD